MTRPSSNGNGMLIHNPQDVHRLRAQIAGWLAVEPNPHIAASIEVPSARGKLVESVPVQVPSRRQRKRSLAKVCEAARKAGADRVIVDGVVIALSPAAAAPAESNGNALDEWMARHENPTKGH
jgi:hypothetical protein